MFSKLPPTRNSICSFFFFWLLVFFTLKKGILRSNFDLITKFHPLLECFQKEKRTKIIRCNGPNSHSLLTFPLKICWEGHLPPSSITISTITARWVASLNKHLLACFLFVLKVLANWYIWTPSVWLWYICRMKKLTFVSSKADTTLKIAAIATFLLIAAIFHYGVDTAI